MSANERVLNSIRSRVQSSIVKHQYASALFWADKAASLSEGNHKDVFWLAQAQFINGQYHRASYLLSSRGLVDQYLCCRYLAAMCHFSCEEWDIALEILNEKDTDPSSEEIHDLDVIESINSAVCLLRGKVYEALDNRTQAIQAYKKALTLDVTCYEAFERLMDHHMLTGEEEKKLLEELPFQDQCSDDYEMVKYLYAGKMKKYEELPEELVKYKPPGSLDSNAEIAVTKAERYYYNCDFRRCYDITSKVLDTDPYHHSCLPIHLACLVELNDVNGLFFLAHKLVDSYPEKSVSWFAVGCYYYLIGNNDNSRRYFGRASRLDMHFGPAWLGFGHSFAAEGEHDQAMAAYCTAARLMSGCHLPLLYVGMEHVATKNPTMAQPYFTQAYQICSRDPMVLHELGVVAFRTDDFAKAEQYFVKALNLCRPDGDNSVQVVGQMWDVTLNNLGLVCQKQKRYQDAIKYYTKSLALNPKSPATYAGLAFAHHCRALVQNTSFSTAIEWYHKALGGDPDDSFSSQMLRRALIEEMERGVES
eukprot:m.19549 g.19549  ORF g.19549 m.19549 type:complete len:533 (+) comp6609_c0_seq1:98-1696(+)